MKSAFVMPRQAIGASVIDANLIAVLTAVTLGQPKILTVHAGRALPSGPFENDHRSLQKALRSWVEQQTGLPLGYVEQLYTFADRDRDIAVARRVISISYLGLTREDDQPAGGDAGWRDWYDYFPWEDRRTASTPEEAHKLERALRAWAQDAASRPQQAARLRRAAFNFGFDGFAWNEELVLQRYELLYEAAIIPEAGGPTRASANADRCKIDRSKIDRSKIDRSKADRSMTGHAMTDDHRRILATGMARLRAKIKYRPVVFELMPETFTFLQLQRCVEALAGRCIHKSNFRRLIEQQELVEETAQTFAQATGRPAKLFRFRKAVLEERATVGTRLPVLRS